MRTTHIEEFDFNMAHAARRLEQVKATFAETAAKHGLGYAIRWKADEVVKAETEVDLYDRCSNVLANITSNDLTAEARLAAAKTLLQQWLMQYVSEATSCSTNPYSNANATAALAQAKNFMDWDGSRAYLKAVEEVLSLAV